MPVPLHWAHPGRRTVTLSVIRHLASDPSRRIGSLFVNPGGPGDSGVDAVASQGETLDAITGGRFDVVGWDPRGSGRSAPVSCFASSAERDAFWHGMPVPTIRQDERRYLAKSVALAHRCGARNGDLLAHISTADTARDLDHLRGLVGDSRLTFLGESTGAMLGQAYANMFPRRVRAMALDGLEDPVRYTADFGTALASTLTDADRTFHEFLAACASWPARSADRYTGPWDATAANPILLIGTKFDPNTPLANARLAERRLGNAVLLTHDGYGHLSQADPSACVSQALGSYLVGLTTPPRGTVCPSDRLPFDPAFGQPAP